MTDIINYSSPGKVIGYHASHEQFPPSVLLDLVIEAEAAGFNAAMCSDHFHPWSQRQGQSGFAWSWLGAALQATSLPFGVVCSPGQRYHPAIVAQAAATLEEIFPGRLWMAAGSGELLNEGITGDLWPLKHERNERLLECAKIMRSLWAGHVVTERGQVRVDAAKLYTLPSRPPRLIGAALTVETAEWMGGWADGLITISRPADEMKKVIDAFRKGGGNGKPIYLQAKISYARDEASALMGAWDQWRSNIFDSRVLSNLRTPEEFDAIGEVVVPEDLYDHVRISSEPESHIEWIQGDMEMGFDAIYLHNVNLDQKSFINDFGRKVLPSLLN